MANKIQLRRDTTANWNNVNPILADGEPGLDITTNQVKYGDGANVWANLSYASGGGSGSTGDWTFTGALANIASYGNSKIDGSGIGGLMLINDSTISINPLGSNWLFQADGNLSLPNNSTISAVRSAETVTLDQLTDISGWAGTLVFTKQNDTRYQALPNGPVMSYIGSNWLIQYAATSWFSSADLITWTVGPYAGTTAPVGTLSIATTNLEVGGNTWKFDNNGNLTLPAGGTITFANNVPILSTITGVTSISTSVSTLTHSDASGDHDYGALGYSYSVNGLTAGFDIQYSEPLIFGNVDISVGNVNVNGNLTLPLGGTIRSANIGLTDSLILTPANVSYPDQQLRIYSTGNVGEGNHIHLTTGNLYTSELYLGDDSYFVKLNNNGNVEIRATALDPYATASWMFSTDGNLTLPAVGEIHSSSGTGNVSIQTNDGNNTYNWTFETSGALILPTVSGNEGAEIEFTKAPNSTLSGSSVIVDQYVDRFRFFESGGTSRGAYIDLKQAAEGVGTLLNNRVSGFVNAGEFVTMDLLKATVTTTSNRGLSLAATTGSFVIYIAGTYAKTSTTGGAMAEVTLTTTPEASMFDWDFGNAGDSSTYIITDTTNNRSYRITLQIGYLYNNNMISIERLI